LFSVGLNVWGCVGDGTTDECSNIKQIDYFKNIFIVDVVCGNYHCLSISKNGEIYSWGDNEFGQLGNGKSGGKENKLSPIQIFNI
jgi:alpha-tubulin suppressor-like RCC1 family protein